MQKLIVIRGERRRGNLGVASLDQSGRCRTGPDRPDVCRGQSGADPGGLLGGDVTPPDNKPRVLLSLDCTGKPKS